VCLYLCQYSSTLAPDDICKACGHRTTDGRWIQPRWKDSPDGNQYFPSYNLSPTSFRWIHSLWLFLSSVVKSRVVFLKLGLKNAFAFCLFLTKYYGSYSIVALVIVIIPSIVFLYGVFHCCSCYCYHYLHCVFVWRNNQWEIKHNSRCMKWRLMFMLM